jgi:sulfite reductase (ferredoxin)
MTETFYKLPSNLAEDIEDHAEDVKRFLSGDLAPGIFKARRVPRGIYEQRKDGTYMLRVRVAGGTLSSVQAVELAVLSNEFGNGILHATTRQDIQLHEVGIADTPEVMRRLMAVGLTSKGGGGNTVRNVAACPYAGICRSEVFDVTPFAHAVTEYLIPLVGSYNLPRKYKIAFSGCGADCALATVNDLGFVASERNGEPGFKVYGGGGMGAHSRPSDLLEEWVPASKTIQLAEAVRRLFDRLGDRHNRNRARLRFVFEKLTAATFIEMLHEEMIAVEKEGVPECDISPSSSDPQNPLCPDNALEEAHGLRFFRQSQPGFVAIPIHLPLGFIGFEDFKALGEIGGEFSEEKGLRTTRSQNLLLRFVKEERLKELADALNGLAIDVVSPQALECFTACAGASTCRLGLCLARDAAKASAKTLDKTKIDKGALRPLRINISGCPNSCGQHPVGDIGLFGSAHRHDDRLVPSYRVLLGAKIGPDGTSLATPIGTVPARALPEFLAELIKDWQDTGEAGRSFATYFKDNDEKHFERILERHTQIPSHDTDPDYYRDWGAEEDFSLAGRGAGECGAGVFEVIDNDIKTAKKALDDSGNADYPSNAFLPTIRALLITRGIDTQDPAQLASAFEEHFINTGLVDQSFKSLLEAGATPSSLSGKEPEIWKLLDRVTLLYNSLDANLQFHPPDLEPESKKDETSGSDAGTVDAVKEIDLKGVACPMNFVKAKLVLETLEKDAVLAITLDEGAPVENVPASFKGEGHDVLETTDLGDGHWRVVIQKKT